MKNLYLVGMMGCGKSTLGKKAAQKLGRAFVDLDTKIEADSGETIPQMFEKHGESYFRDAETAALNKASRENELVVACGGGVVLRKKNIELMKNSGRIVYIDRPIEKIMADVDTSVRPLLSGGAHKAKALYEQRKMLYEEYADEIIINDGNINAAVEKIVSFAKRI